MSSIMCKENNHLKWAYFRLTTSKNLRRFVILTSLHESWAHMGPELVGTEGDPWIELNGPWIGPDQ